MERPRNAKIKVPKTITDVGRVQKFTPERRAAIVDAIANRIPYAYAAEANGIVETTLYDWLNTGRAHQVQNIESPYTEFLLAVKKAEMNRIREHSDNIAGRPERWQGDAWLLERRWYKHYGPNAQLNELNNRLQSIEQGKIKTEVETEEKKGEKA